MRIITHKSQAVADALKIASNPETYADQPGLRFVAWATLKSARGQTMRQRNITPFRGKLGLIAPVRSAAQ
ncbi:MAG: hypothetical protein COA53_06545 [Rhodobacteraceae bacterium]|nr:MAG: hypothetical protein COA53_06545 [Paracoccaceae bacterium]